MIVTSVILYQGCLFHVLSTSQSNKMPQALMEVCYCVGVLLIELATIKETAFIGAYIDVSVC